MALETVIALASKPLVTALVDKLVTPKIEKFSDWCKGKYDEYLIPTAEHFQEYLERSYNKYSIINTLVFNNSQMQLNSIYVTQSLVKENRSDNKEITKIDKVPVSLIKKYKKILIKDTAGMGKSTIMKYMFINMIDNGLEEIGIPIYIELNRLKKDWTILQEMQRQLNSLSKDFNNQLLLNFIQSGGFIFFLDGYDEIPNDSIIEVTSDIHDFISKAGTANYYILTSRPENGLSSFGDFQSFSINPLSKEEAYGLLEKYDRSDNKEISNKLIEKLKSGEYSAIDDYLKNPLLVSLLYAAFDYKPDIPMKKHLFYKQVYTAYFDSHDFTKGMKPHEKRSGLDIYDFGRVLKCVGYICLKSTGTKFEEDKILKIIGKAKLFCINLEFKELDFLNDMLSAVPLFCRDGNEYKWVHKSLMEYFAARFIADDVAEKKEDYLKDIYEDSNFSKYENMLDLYYDIDYKGFSKHIMLPFLKDFAIYYDKHYPKSLNISSIMIEERIGFFYYYDAAGIMRKRNIRKYDGKIIDPNDLGSLNSFISEQAVKSKNANEWFGCLSYYNDYVMFVCSYSSKKSILTRLLFHKLPTLFNIYEDHREINEFDDSVFKEGMTYYVNVMSGFENENIFGLINHLLLDADATTYFYLKYNSVKQVIEKLIREIEQSNNTSNLLSGLL